MAACGEKKAAEVPPVVTVDVAPVLLSKIQRTVRADGLLYPKQQAAIVPKISAPGRARAASVTAGKVCTTSPRDEVLTKRIFFTAIKAPGYSYRGATDPYGFDEFQL